MRDDAHCCTSKLILSADAQIATFLRIRQLPRSTRRQCEGGSRNRGTGGRPSGPGSGSSHHRLADSEL